MKKHNEGAAQEAPLKTFIKSFIYSGDNAAAEKKTTKMILLCILFAAGVIAKSVVDLKDEIRTVIMPSWTTESMQIRGTTANQFYLEEMAEYLSHLYGNIGPGDARSKLDMIVRLAHPTQFEVIREKMSERADSIEKLKTTTFHSRLMREKGIYNRTNFKHGYSGVKREDVQQLQFSVNRTAVIDGNPERPDMQHYSVDFVIEKGRFYLLDYYEVKGHER